MLLHQDLHGDNVLAAHREPWLAIDPKPLVGEREFAVAPIARSFELGHSKRDVLHRFDRLTAGLGLDRERARGWTIAQTVAWSRLERRIARQRRRMAPMKIEAVIFDVDFTNVKPGPDFGPEGYARLGERFGSCSTRAQRRRARKRSRR